MDLASLLRQYSANRIQKAIHDDTFSDRLNHKYSSFVCLFFAIIISTKQYIGDPIDCWGPAQFKSSYERYMDSYCWLKNTYVMGENEELPPRSRRANEIRYYQWSPLILAVQAAMFYFPKIVWRSIGSQFGLNLRDLVECARKYEEDVENQTQHIRYICAAFERVILLNATNSKRMAMHRRPRTLRRFTSGCQLSILCLFVKLLWVANGVAQLLAMNALFASVREMYGLKFVSAVMSGGWQASSRSFPKVTFCDFEIKEIGYSHHYTVQCVLKANLLNEVAYTFLWIWIAFVVIISVVDLIICSISMTPFAVYSFLQRQSELSLIYTMGDADAAAVSQLVRYLQSSLSADCVLCLRIIEKATSNLVTLQLIHGLWRTDFRSPRWFSSTERTEEKANGNPSDV